MSAEILRLASLKIRGEVADVDSWLGAADRPFYLALADLLEATAEMNYDNCLTCRSALAVASAYLGVPS